MHPTETFKGNRAYSYYIIFSPYLHYFAYHFTDIRKMAYKMDDPRLLNRGIICRAVSPFLLVSLF